MSSLNDMQTLLRQDVWEDSRNKNLYEEVYVGEDDVFVDMGYCHYPNLDGDPAYAPYFWISVNLRKRRETYHWKSESRKNGKVEISRCRWDGQQIDTVSLRNFIDTCNILQGDIDLLLITYPWIRRAAEILARAVFSHQFKRVRIQEI